MLVTSPADPPAAGRRRRFADVDVLPALDGREDREQQHRCQHVADVDGLRHPGRLPPAAGQLDADDDGGAEQQHAEEPSTVAGDDPVDLPGEDGEEELDGDPGAQHPPGRPDREQERRNARVPRLRAERRDSVAPRLVQTVADGAPGLRCAVAAGRQSGGRAQLVGVALRRPSRTAIGSALS
jgi:hypothetical protein